MIKFVLGFVFGTITGMTTKPLSPFDNETVRSFVWRDSPQERSGRRMRVFAALVRARTETNQGTTRTHLTHEENTLATVDAPQVTYAAAMALLDGHAALANLKLRIGYDTAPTHITQLDQITNTGYNPELPEALQDVANDVFFDIHEACQAFDNPNLYYPGVDDGIEPVPDDHVKLVIAAIERELSRETRPPLHASSYSPPKLPPAPLHDLPWRIQRALVERRRLRFAQWGIGRTEWEQNRWSLWSVPLDPDWTPRWPPPGI